MQSSDTTASANRQQATAVRRRRCSNLAAARLNSSVCATSSSACCTSSAPDKRKRRVREEWHTRNFRPPSQHLIDALLQDARHVHEIVGHEVQVAEGAHVAVLPPPGVDRRLKALVRVGPEPLGPEGLAVLLEKVPVQRTGVLVGQRLWVALEAEHHDREVFALAAPRNGRVNNAPVLQRNGAYM
jgi:hypothetical protein